jgi:hypothetical protein
MLFHGKQALVLITSHVNVFANRSEAFPLPFLSLLNQF